MKMLSVQWCDDAEKALGRLIAPELFRIYMEWIEKGICKLWKITGENYTTWLITRIEIYPCGLRELVLEAISGKNARQIVAAIVARAKSLGFKKVRFETHHSEAVALRFMGGIGFKRRATVLEKLL